MFNSWFPEYWSTLKKLIFLKASALSGSLVTLTGTIVSFIATKVKAIKSLTVTLEPQQDLHGQDAPYPAGGGVNKFDKDSAVNGKWLNVSTGVEEATSTNYSLSDYIPVESGKQYIWTNTQSSRCWFYDTSKSPVEAVTNPYTPNANGYIRLTIGVVSVDIDTFMFVQGSSLPQTYSPYSNICPITGVTGASVTRTGKNLFPNGGDITVYERELFSYQNPIILKGQTVTISGDVVVGGGYTSCLVFLIRKNNGGITNKSFTSANRSATWTATEDVYGVNFYATNSGSTNPGVTTTWSNFQIELGSTATPYEAPSITTLSVTFPDTVYGGEYEVVSGKVKPYKEYDSYNGETLTGRWMSSIDKYVAGTTPTIGAQVVDLESFGTTIEVTPQPINTLAGENNVWSDSGDVSVTASGITPIE